MLCDDMQRQLAFVVYYLSSWYDGIDVRTYFNEMSSLVYINSTNTPNIVSFYKHKYMYTVLLYTYMIKDVPP